LILFQFISNAPTMGMLRPRAAELKPTDPLVPNYTEGVRECQPRVSTLGTSSDGHFVTPQALANTCGVNQINLQHSQRSHFASKAGLKLANAFGVKTLLEKQRTNNLLRRGTSGYARV
jgi:hypothetical protein